MNLLFVAAGGAAGASLRYIFGLIPIKSDFPFVTLGINFLGAVLIGVIAGLAGRTSIPQNAVLFLKTGLCGGFTTFSTFSLESFGLIKSGKLWIAALYCVSSVLLCLVGVFIGQLITASKA